MFLMVKIWYWLVIMVVLMIKDTNGNVLILQVMVMVIMFVPQEVRDERGGVPFEVEQPPD